mmetsp:Transcript_23135/g.72086  ORF Transcript_23135/g.72086 Transcript_23135/m.72086 type:complete len:462 (-) Transcript_23135:149-1534(-)
MRRDVPVQLVLHGRLAVALDHHGLLAQVVGDVRGGRARDVDPRLGEDGAARDDEGEVEDGAEGVEDHVHERQRRGQVVHEPVRGPHGAGVGVRLPRAERLDEDVRRVHAEGHLRQEVEVREQAGLQDHRRVARVEQLDGVRVLLRAVALVLDGQRRAPALEVDDDGDDEPRRDELREVGQVRAVEGVPDGHELVGAREQQVEECEHGALELLALRRGDRGGAEGLPHDGLADVDGHEEARAATDAVAFLQQLVEQQHHDAGAEELHGDEHGVARAERGEVAVHARGHVGHGHEEREADADDLLEPLEAPAVLRRVLVHRDGARAAQVLHEHGRRHDGRDAQLHERAAVRREDHAQPVERVARQRPRQAVERQLAAAQEDEQHAHRPEQAVAEGRPALRSLHNGENPEHRPDGIDDPALGDERAGDKLHHPRRSLRRGNRRRLLLLLASRVAGVGAWETPSS